MPYCPFFFIFLIFYFSFSRISIQQNFSRHFFFQLSRVLVCVTSHAARPRSRCTTFRCVISFHPIASFPPFIHLSYLVHPKLYKTSRTAIFFALDITNYYRNHHHHHHDLLLVQRVSTGGPSMQVSNSFYYNSVECFDLDFVTIFLPQVISIPCFILTSCLILYYLFSPSPVMPSATLYPYAPIHP